jgi:Tfp pilus assembly protein FimT
VVVALVGILSALIIPGMHGTYEEALLRSTSRELIDAFQVAYSQSVSFGQPHRFHFDPSTHRYAVEKVLGDEGREDYVPLRDVPGCEGRLDMRIAIHIRAVPDPTVASGGSDSDDSPRPESGQLSFYPDGTADARDVLLEDRDGFRLLLRVNPVTARVRIFELRRQLRDQ